MKDYKQKIATEPRLFEIIKKKIEKSALSVDQPLLPQSVTVNNSVRNSRLRFLNLVPIVLFIIFFISFFYDLNGKSLIIGQTVFYFDNLLKILSISGLIGFFTNWVAIIMLFRPQQKRPLLGQGLVPAQKSVIAIKLSNAVNKNLINPDQIRVKLVESGILSSVIKEIEHGIGNLGNDEEFRDELFKVLTDAVGDYLAQDEIRGTISEVLLNHIDGSFQDNSFEKYVFKVYKNLRKDQIASIIDQAILSVPNTIYEHRNSFNDTILAIPEEISQQRDRIEEYLITGIYDILQRINLRSIIEDNLNNYDESRLEDLIKDSTIDQLNYIKYLGAVLGVLGGFIIWNPLPALVILGLLFGSYFALDHFLFSIKKSS